MALEYSKVSVPKALMDRLTAIVDDHPELGYRSASEAATRAIQQLAESLEERYVLPGEALRSASSRLYAARKENEEKKRGK